MALWRSGRTIFRPSAQRHPSLGHLLSPSEGRRMRRPSNAPVVSRPGNGSLRPFGVVRPFDTRKAPHAQGPGAGSADSCAAPDGRRPAGRPYEIRGERKRRRGGRVPGGIRSRVAGVNGRGPRLDAGGTKGTSRSAKIGGVTLIRARDCTPSSPPSAGSRRGPLTESTPNGATVSLGGRTFASGVAAARCHQSRGRKNAARIGSSRLSPP